MARAVTHTLNERHLAVLKWLAAQPPTDENPSGWTRELRIQRGIKKAGLLPPDKQAIGEALSDLTVQLNPNADPFVIAHKSGTHYRISGTGRKLARTCIVVDKQTPKGDERIVVEKSTGKPPVIKSTESTEQLPDDDEDGLEDMPRAKAPSMTEAEEDHAGAEGGEPESDADDTPREVEDDEQNDAPGTDEINDVDRAPPRAPKPMQTKPSGKKPKPAHTRARVPATEE